MFYCSLFTSVERVVWTVTCMASSGETSDSLGGFTPVGLQKDIKKEEPADEDYLCKSLGHITVRSVDQEYTLNLYLAFFFYFPVLKFS